MIEGRQSRGNERVILDSINEGVFRANLEWWITVSNCAAERITQVIRRQAPGRRCCDVFRAGICEKECAPRRTLDRKLRALNIEAPETDGRGRNGGR